MKLNRRAFLSIMLAFVLLFHLYAPTAYGAEVLPAVKVALSADESIIVERIVYTALEKSGYQMVTTTSGMRTSINDVNYGDAAIVPAQAKGLDIEYNNLIMVPVPISYVETNAYTRSGEPYEFYAWSDLKGLRLSHRWQNAYVTRNVPRAEASQVVTLNEYGDLWNSLLTKETDVAVIPNLTGFVRIVPEGIKLAGIIEREPRYTYVNKEYSYLVPLLTKAYEEMTNDGTMERIRNSEQRSDKQVVLHINSYSTQVEWERNMADTIRKSLEVNPKLEYHSLNLSSRQSRNREDSNAIIVNTIRTNFIERNPDLIIASNNDALEFVLTNYYMLFPKVPVVFCGVNNFDSSMLHGFEEYVTGLSEAVSLKETASEMLRLYPQTQRIYVLNDYSHSGLEWRYCIQECFDAAGLPVALEFNENKPIAEILEKIQNLDNETLVLLGTYFVDSNNVFFTENELQKLISDASKLPVFCLADSFNGNGTLGGRLSSSRIQGQIAGDMANAILKGSLPSEIPVITDTEYLNIWQFDYAVADKFYINTSSLPKDHNVINRKLPFWESNPFEFKIAATAGGFLLVIIIGMAAFLNLMRQKNAHLLEMQRHLHSAEELLEKDNDLRKLIESLLVPVFIADIENFRLEYANQVFLTANALDSFEQAKQLNLAPLVEQTLGLLSDKTISFDYGVLGQSDTAICQKISANRMMYHDKNCLLFISEDISAQIKKNEMLASAAQKEKEANALKSIFLANMSHEIRTPMNAIIGLSQLALFKEQTAENKEYFLKISSSAKNLLSIINDILDFSKIEAEKLDLVEEEFELEETISNAFMVAVDRIDDKPIELLLDMKTDVPFYLRGDSTRLWQILKNILDNAVKYSSAGLILLSVETVGFEKGIVTLCFRISDTGIGMTPEQLSRLFMPFEQLHPKGFKSKKIGTGLGMSITKQLVDLMQGQIEVSSQINCGTEFTVTLPFKFSVNPKNIHDVSWEYANSPEGQVGPVLLVDDDSTSLRIMRSLLEDIGVSVATASNSEEAFDVTRRHAEEGIVFKTVIVDYLMGSENGLDIAKQIKLINGGTRLLLVTAYVRRILSEEILTEAGIEDVIEKPFIISEFIRKVCGIKTVELPDELENITFSKAQVLICEDILVNQMILEGILNEFGIKPVIVSNGYEAIELLEKQRFDLIFMDIIMPVMDGHETTIAIRQSDKAYKNTPICAMTANAMLDEVQQCISEGMNAHLEKPIDIQMLTAVLNDILSELAD